MSKPDYSTYPERVHNVRNTIFACIKFEAQKIVDMLNANPTDTKIEGPCGTLYILKWDLIKATELVMAVENHSHYYNNFDYFKNEVERVRKRKIYMTRTLNDLENRYGK